VSKSTITVHDLWVISKAAAETKEEEQKVDYKNLPSAAKCPYWLRCREAFLELAHREGILDRMKQYMVADAPVFLNPKPGRQVRIKGLQSELNGKTGNIIQVDDDNMYCVVKVSGMKEVVRLAVTNLVGDEDKCFCKDCHASRGDIDVYTRGDPGKDFVLPVGFARLALQIHDTPDVQETAFAKWHVCYHGTKHGSILQILKQGKLLKPGDPTYTGRTIGVRPGHFEEAHGRKNLHTKAEEHFDPTKNIFFSPSIKYCDYGNVYMSNFESSRGKHYRFAFQVRLQSGQYEIGQETVGAGDTLIDDNVPNSSIEWYSHNALHLLTGLLIREV
jgi:hypothetical protein